MKRISQLIAFHVGLHIPPCDPQDPVYPVSCLLDSVSLATPDLIGGSGW